LTGLGAGRQSVMGNRRGLTGGRRRASFVDRACEASSATLGMRRVNCGPLGNWRAMAWRASSGCACGISRERDANASASLPCGCRPSSSSRSACSDGRTRVRQPRTIRPLGVDQLTKGASGTVALIERLRSETCTRLHRCLADCAQRSARSPHWSSSQPPRRPARWGTE
jgi:hypothetical protein